MRKKLYVIAIIIAILVSTLMVTVQAAELSCKTTMKTLSEKVEKGKEVTVTISVSEINAGKKGINSIKGTLEYDDKVFEEITADSIEGSNEWNATYSKDSGKVTLLKTSFVKEDEEVCQINLKVKANATATKGTIEFKNIVASNSESEVSSEDISLDVEIDSADEENESKNENKNKNNTIAITTNKNTNKNNTNTNKESNTNTNTNKNSNTNSNTNKNVNNSNKISNNTNKTNNNANVTNQTTEEMPDTGIDDTIVKAIILVVLVGAVGYMKMKSLEQK